MYTEDNIFFNYYNNNGDENSKNSDDRSTSPSGTNTATAPTITPDRNREYNYVANNPLDKPVAKGGVSCPFPWRVHEMLKVAHEENLTHIVSWCPHGRAFMVHDPAAFAETIMTRFFCQTKYASFQRQLNLYGFQRFLHHSRDKGAYYHPCFVRGNRALVRNILRRKIKGSSSSAASKILMPHEEPDFYKTMSQRNISGTSMTRGQPAVVPPMFPEMTKILPNSHTVLTQNASTGTAYFEGSRFHVVGDGPSSEPSSTSRRSSSKKKNDAQTILAQELAKIREQIRQKQAEYQTTVAKQHMYAASKRVSWQTNDFSDNNNDSIDKNILEEFSPLEESLYVAL